MTCGSCSTAVEQALSSVTGVSKAVVSLIQQEARVDYQAALTSEARSETGLKYLANTSTICPFYN